MQEEKIPGIKPAELEGKNKLPQVVIREEFFLGSLCM